MLDAIEAVIQASDPAKREVLAQTIDRYREDFPDEFRWATGVSAPLLLVNVMMAIDASCRPEFAAKCPFRNFLNRLNLLDSNGGGLIRRGAVDVDA